MPVLKEIEVPFPFEAEIRMRGGRHRQHPLYGWANAVVPVVTGEEAPAILRAKGVRVARDREPQDIEWRVWRGLHWRPVLDDMGVPQVVDAEDFTCEPPRSGRSFRWTDHPCGLRFGKRFVGGPDALGFWPCETAEFLPRGDRIVGGNRAEVAALAVKVALEEMAEIDGVLHKRAALPMWSLGWSPNLDRYDGEILLVVPDFGGRAPPSLGLVPPTHLDLARELAAALVQYEDEIRQVRRFDGLEGSWSPREPEGTVEVIGDVPAGDLACHTLLHAHDMFTLVVNAAPYRPKLEADRTLSNMIDCLSRLNDAPYGMHHFARDLADAALGRAYDAMADELRPRRDLLAVLMVPIAVADRCRDYEWNTADEIEAFRPGQ